MSFSLNQHRAAGSIVSRWTVTILNSVGLRVPFFGPSYAHSRAHKHHANEILRDLFRDDEHRALRTWLGTTALLGSIFIAGQVYEFKEFLNFGYGFTHSPAWSAFFALTGFHGVHVTLGIVMLLSTLALSLTGRIGRPQAEAVEIVGLYWHFVDVVWVIIFTVVYLIN